MSSLKLKQDGWIKRKYSPKIKENPVRPLTDEERTHIQVNCWEKCHRAYRNRMMASGLISDFETQDDLLGEAWIAMNEILDRFDLSRCGEVSQHDVPGGDKPKTLVFYFLNYFYGRVNFMACEARTHKKSRNVQSYGAEISETEYSPIDERAGNDSSKYEITENILYELRKKSKEFQRFFYQIYGLQCSYKELVDEYSQSGCKQKRAELVDFIDSLKSRYNIDYVVPYKEKRKRGRKKKPPVSEG